MVNVYYCKPTVHVQQFVQTYPLVHANDVMTYTVNIIEYTFVNYNFCMDSSHKYSTLYVLR